jgi:transposase-like protein
MFKGRPFDRSVILLCVRWYLAYGLSLRDLKQMMAERGISIDRSTIHRWVVHFSPLLLKCFNRRKRAVGGKWHMDDPEGSAEQQDIHQGSRPLDVPIEASTAWATWSRSG